MQCLYFCTSINKASKLSPSDACARLPAEGQSHADASEVLSLLALLILVQKYKY
jgi:hypothetical protein